MDSQNAPGLWFKLLIGKCIITFHESQSHRFEIGHIHFSAMSWHLTGFWTWLFCIYLHKNLLCTSETTIEGLETQPRSPELFPQFCARLLDATSRVFIRHLIYCGNTNWTTFSETFCVERIRENDLNIRKHMSFEAALYLHCRKAI